MALLFFSLDVDPDGRKMGSPYPINNILFDYPPGWQPADMDRRCLHGRHMGAHYQGVYETRGHDVVIKATKAQWLPIGACLFGSALGGSVPLRNYS